MRRVAAGLVVAAAAIAAVGCSGASGGTGTPGTGGGSGGAGAVGGAGGAGGAPTFQAVAPCAMEGSYVTPATVTTGGTITFGGAQGDNYTPACLQVMVGTTVTFVGDFVAHPLTPSAARGTLTGNPITATGTGATASFTFPTPGFWAYFCAIHGSDADGQRMTGVIWAR